VGASRHAGASAHYQHQHQHTHAHTLPSAGGQHVPKISARAGAASITHLVLVKAEGDKFRFAVRHGVEVVSDMWLVESALAGGWGAGAAAAAAALRLRRAVVGRARWSDVRGWRGRWLKPVCCGICSLRSW
jgi:hypothetical protein